jgi:hypothetical protein
MSTSIANKKSPPEYPGRPVSYRIYEQLLRAYPAKFRDEYGAPMAQVFRDCHRAEKRRGKLAGIAGLWLRTLLDVAHSAPQQHIESLTKEESHMKNLKNDAVALLGCVGIIALALVVLTYGRKHEVSSILLFGHVLDALATAGIVGNLIVFLLVKTTKLNPLQIALWTFLAINVVLLLAAALIGGRVDSQFSFGSVLIGYAVSFIFWFGMHWIWARSRDRTEVAT